MCPVVFVSLTEENEAVGGHKVLFNADESFFENMTTLLCDHLNQVNQLNQLLHTIKFAVL